MSKDCLMAHGFLLEKMRNLRGGNLDNVEKNNRIMFGNTSKNYVVQACGKRQREDRVPLGVRSLVGKMNRDNLEKILRWLDDDKIDKIGVFGMGGCGKTALAIHVYNRLLQSELSRVLVWVTLEIGFDVRKLQLCISSAVGLDLEYEKDETRRAARLNTFLSKRGRYVLILDNMWDQIPFEKVGIPSSGACKVIITTRLLSICRKTGCQRTIKMGMLGAFEAWELFSRVLGHEALAADDIRYMAQLVCQECAGLPLAIVHLARILRGVNNISEWKLTLHRLKGISKEQDFMITKHIFLKLHPSYTRLTSEIIKLSLLYCSLYPKNYTTNREELIRLLIAVGLIEEVPSLQAQYDKGYTILNHLMDCSLLETSENGNFVNMHGMIRDMTIRITRQKIGPRFLVKCGAHLKDVAEALDFKEDFLAVSLMTNCITEIPSSISPKCPKLSVLLLQHNPLKNISDSFFLNMPCLRVLDLSNTGIQRVPDSICVLKNLRSLLLRFCQKLTYVPSLENANALQVLDLGYSAIEQIPCGLEKLTLLRELDLSGFHKLKDLGHGLFTRLPALKRISCYAVGNLQELHHLKSLEILDATFESISDYSSYVKSEHWQSLDSFHLQVGDAVEQENQSDKVQWHYNNAVSFYGCSLAVEREQLVFPKNLNQLYIDKCEGLSSLCNMLYWDDKPNSKDSLSSGNFHKVNFEGYNGENKNPYWENTSLHSSKEGMNGNLKSGLLPNLELCTISRCNDIKKLFTPLQMMNLQNLEILEIRNCIELRDLITEEDGEKFTFDCNAYAVKLPSLKKLELTQLPMLSSIYKGLLFCTSLQSILVDHCPKLTRLPFSFFMDDQHKLLLPMLEKIEGQEEWWNSLELNQIETKLSLQTLFRPKSSSYSASESKGDLSQTGRGMQEC